MISSAFSSNTYTDAPELHRNMLLGGLQLLAWLFFHPSAWRNHVARIDPMLRANFALTESSREQWRNLALRQLLLIGYVILPVLTSVLVGLLLWIMGVPGQDIVANMLDTIALGMVTGVVVGLTVNVAVGVIYGSLISIAIGVAPDHIGRVAYDIVIGTPIRLTPAEISGMVRGLLLGVAAGIASSVAVSVANQMQSHSFVRQIGGFIAGIFIGGVMLAIAYSLMSGVLLGSAAVGRIGAAAGIGRSITFGLGGGVLLFLAYSLTVGIHIRKWSLSLAVGLAVGIGGGLAYGVAVGVGSDTLVYHLAGGTGGGILFGILFALPYLLAERIAGSWAGAVTGALVSGLGWVSLKSFIFTLTIPLWPTLPLTLVTILLGLTLAWWRPVVLYPFLVIWNSFLRRTDERRSAESLSLLRWHSAFWDEYQRLPMFRLDEHLVLIAERNPTEGQVAIDYLSTGRQRWAAQAAQIELEARWLESCANVETIGSIHRSLSAGELAGPASALLRSFSRLSQDIMAALQQASAYNQRLALSTVEDRLDSLLRELTRSNERYAVRFRPIATKWRQVVANRVQELAEAVESRQEIDNPYVIGVPLTEQQEIFVGRTDISARIEQLLLDRRRPPLLLYGQRRMGKTSLLNNLGRLLPSTITPFFIDLQGPASQARDHAGFFYNIARGMINSARRQRDLTLPPLAREDLAIDPFTYFDEWLDDVEQVLGQHTGLVTLDEFEALDSAIAKGNIDGRALLNMMRHLIQHRPRFKILLTSSQTLEDFQRWSSYLINIQVVQLSYLNQAEARQLIERPAKDFALNYEPAASQRVLDLTRGHPFLVQLLCSEIVALKNEQDPTVRRLARLSDVEAAVPEALSRGSFFFADIERNQIDAAALAVLHFLAAQGEGNVVNRDILAGRFADQLDQTLALLTRRELIESTEEGYRFQVELIRRWFAQT